MPCGVLVVKQPWQRLRSAVIGLLAGVVILLAVASLLGRALLPMVDGHPQRLAELLGHYLQQPVAVGSVSGRWQASGPMLAVTDLRIGTGGDALRVPQAVLKVDLGAWLRADRDWLELRIRDVQARLVADANGSWRLAGVVFQGQRLDWRKALPDDMPVSVSLRNLTLVIHDPRRHLRLRLQIPELRVVARDGRLHLAGQLRQSGAQGAIGLVASIDPAQKAGRLYLAGRNLDLKRWTRAMQWSELQVQQGRGSARVWLAWQDGLVHRLTAQLRVGGLTVAAADQVLVERDEIAGLLQLRRGHDYWQLHWQPRYRNGATAAALDIAHYASGRLRIQARDINLAKLSPWLALWPALAQGQPPAWAALRPWGRIQSLALDWRDRDHLALQARVTGLGWKPVPGLPGVDHLDVRVRGDGQAVSVHLPEQAATITYPSVFRKPFALTRVHGDVSWWSGPRGWHVETGNLTLAAPYFAVRVRGGLRQAPGHALPMLDVAARLTRAEVPAAKRFWPVHIMPEDAVSWLDRGLAAGRVSGRAVFRGVLGEGPFAGGPGRFEAVGQFRDAVLDYGAGWPRATNLAGELHFINNAMHITATDGRTKGNRVARATATIADFRRAVLQLQVRGEGQTARLLNWLRATPVGQRRAAALGQVRVRGAADYRLELTLPLHAGGPPMQLDGQVELAGVHAQAPQWSFAVDDVRGLLHFGSDGVRAPELSASYHGQPVTLALAIGAASGDADTALQVSMQGRLDAASLVAGRPRLASLGQVLAGSAEFQVGLRVRSDSAPEGGGSVLTLDSDLEGIQIALPAPLAKPADKVQPLHLSVRLQPEHKRVHLTLGTRLAVRARLPGPHTPLAVDVALGKPAQRPQLPGIFIHGQVPTLALGGWLKQAAALPISDPTGTLPLLRIDLDIGDLRVAGDSLGALQLRVKPRGKRLSIQLDGEAVAGHITVPLTRIGSRGITARLERLYWPEADPDDQADKVADAPVAPAAIPPLHLWVKDLRLGAAHFGNVRVESVPVDGGMQVQKFEVQSANVQISARGRWTGSSSDSHSRFAIDMSADDLGRMLQAFGFPRLVAGGATLAHIEGQWPGSPLAFSLKRLDGHIDVHVTDGRILKVEPGIGRLFGLFSIRQLPRRLALDFGDIFQSGYSFNSIEGSLRFARGNAWSDLDMQGPSADLQVRGRTGLRQHDYNILVTVTPHLGVAFAVVGALAAGPVGAAAGLAVQGLLGKDVNRAAQSWYRITGSWKDPAIRKLKQPPGPWLNLTPPASAGSAPPPATATSVRPAASRPASAAGT